MDVTMVTPHSSPLFVQSGHITEKTYGTFMPAFAAPSSSPLAYFHASPNSLGSAPLLFRLSLMIQFVPFFSVPGGAETYAD